MAIIKVLDVDFIGDGLNARKLTKVDKIESDGSLLLLDPTHPIQQWGGGAVNNNYVVPNLLAEKLTTLAGTGVGVDSTVTTSGTSSNMIIERTSKNGLHVLLKQASITNEFLRLLPPAAVMDYINAHKDHSYYFSLWQKTTMKTTYPNGPFSPSYMHIATSSGATGMLVYMGCYDLWIAGNVSANKNVVSPSEEINHLFVGSTSPNVVTTDIGLGSYTSLFEVGNSGPWNGSGTGNSTDKLPSQILYRAYIEDLTVSGRSYADVFAIDNEMYTKEVLTEGGRYYGDTFTDPYTAFA